MAKRTALYEQHLADNGKIVDFAGWEMPLHYGSQLEEHNAVRATAGMFDVSHMQVVDIVGIDAKKFLRRLLANDVAKLKPGKALYSCMLNQQAGVIDDLIAYDVGSGNYRAVVNAGTAAKDLAWMRQQAVDFSVAVKTRDDLSIIAVQGPKARAFAIEFIPKSMQMAVRELKPFWMSMQADWMVARTGYTGEDGFEIILPNVEAVNFWRKLLEVGVKPCGLGARDSLRLEAGMNLYGTDMDESITPLEAGLAWTLAMTDEHEFIGKQALQDKKASGVTSKFVGLILQDKGILRGHQKIIVDGIGEGEVTSGGFSPTLGVSIALARVPKATNGDCLVEIRRKNLRAKVVKPPFVRNGKKVFADE